MDIGKIENKRVILDEKEKKKQPKKSKNLGYKNDSFKAKILELKESLQALYWK